MGVDNLMGFVKPATVTTHIKRNDLSDSTAAVDISHWIYKASYSCPEALYHKELSHKAYARICGYIDNYVKLLRSHNIKLIFVFDGIKLPAKKVTHMERSARKAESRKMVEHYLAKKKNSEARKFMLRCVDIKFDVIQQVILYCQRENIKYIVAPYEADAQLAYLDRTEQCDYIITEDSDLILYGCKRIVYKLDSTGNCVLYSRTRLGKCLGNKGEKTDFEKFRRMCILSGCDYLKNLPSVGLQSAKKFFSMTQQDNLRLLLPKLGGYLKKASLAGKVTEEYIKGFIDAETTFRHHIVYDTASERLVPLEPYPRGKSSSDFPLAGRHFHRVLAKELVAGKIDLDTLDPERDLDTASSASEAENDDE